LVEEAKTADDPKLTKDKRQAEELVSFAYKFICIQAHRDEGCE
jgi:hypothetical protein